MPPLRWQATSRKYNALERGVEKEALPFCRDHGIGMLAYSPIAKGLLTGKVTMDRVFPENDLRRHGPWFSPDSRKRALHMLDSIRPVADGHGVTLAQLAINWVISQPGVTTALVGARSKQQVEENAKSADFKLTDEELQTIRTAVESVDPPAQ